MSSRSTLLPVKNDLAEVCACMQSAMSHVVKEDSSCRHSFADYDGLFSPCLFSLSEVFFDLCYAGSRVHALWAAGIL